MAQWIYKLERYFPTGTMLLKPNTYTGLNVLYKSRVIDLISFTITFRFDGIHTFLSSSAVTYIDFEIGIHKFKMHH